MFSLALRLGPRPKPDTADCTPRAHEVRELGKQGPVVGPVSTGCGPARTARASHDLVQLRPHGAAWGIHALAPERASARYCPAT